MKKLLLPIVLAIGVHGSANAADGVIEFKGEIISPPCTLSPANANIAVPLGTYTTDALSGKGTQTTAQNFDIILTNCSAEKYTSVETRFNFTADSADEQYIAINGADKASGVAIKLMEQDGSVIKPNTKSKAIPLPDNQGLNLSYKASYVSTEETVGEGSANATGTFELLYQ
ncbi:type 1 fimbrial protein [Salmonella enterica subsp. enterica]|nr:type 1 fimbrial protein [Salmonella enterica subsp. enterica serovar Bonn]EBZ5939343.1 type 1 fimbrial protein [Salmonella enterica subsp. enterica serovar Muenchen]MLZ41086.1 type 1 fimbrial protein [Salmonella enterica subsp. enterica serovar Bonn]